jgi:hypothetical protein
MMVRPVEIFFSYAHADEELMHDVRRQLVLFDRQGIIRKWHDRLIQPGTGWRGQIDDRLQHSDIILLFISSHFFESDYCYDAEMTEAMRRHDLGDARVIPIILRPCSWDSAPFAQLQALPTDGRPISLWPDRDEACLNAADGVMRVVREIRGETNRANRPLVAEDPERTIAFRVHRAHFVGVPKECYFINLTNLSPRRTLEITHIWYEDETHHIPVHQALRPLPVRIDTDQSWETWIEAMELPARYRGDAFERFRARISTGRVFASQQNFDVPPIGSVSGGPVR